MNCRQARARLVPLIDEELAPGEAIQVRAHLDGCASCARARESLQASLPLAPVIALDPNARHAMHLALDLALDDADQAPAAPIGALGGVRRALVTEVGVPRGLLLLYAAALVLAIGWAAGRGTPNADVDVLTHNAADAGAAAQLELHRPAAYVPEGGWF